MTAAVLAAQHVHQSSNSNLGLAVGIGVIGLLIWRDKRKGKGGG